LKHVRIAVAGIIDEPIIFLLRRGVTAGVILKQLQLEDHILFTLPTSEQLAYSLLPSDDVYCEVRSGDPLLAVPASEAKDLSMRLSAYANYIFSTPQQEEEPPQETAFGEEAND
jgi:Ran GTPase-activating protein (RanGAP) involved in mRNA processing and transport